MQCPNCHIQIAGGASFCGKCGTSIETQPSNNPYPVPPPWSNSYTIPAYAPPTPPPGHTSRKLLRLPVSLSVLILLVVIIFSSIGIAMYKNNANASYDSNATTTAATAQVSAYPSYLRGKGTLVLVDSLSQEGQWRPQSVNSHGGSCQFTTGAYHVSESQRSGFMECSSIRTFSNFAFELHLTISEGDCGGITFRESRDWQFYYFQICQDGLYTVFKYSKAHIWTLQERTHSGAISTGSGQPNKIAVVAEDDTLTFYINEQKIDQKHDNSYTLGNIGLVAFPEQNHPTDVAYTNARVWVV